MKMKIILIIGLIISSIYLYLKYTNPNIDKIETKKDHVVKDKEIVINYSKLDKDNLENLFLDLDKTEFVIGKISFFDFKESFKKDIISMSFDNLAELKGTAINLNLEEKNKYLAIGIIYKINNSKRYIKAMYKKEEGNYFYIERGLFIEDK